MINKKSKTIEDIVYSAFYDNSRLKVIRYCNEDEWPIKEVSQQIKQLIADEVIVLVKGKRLVWSGAVGLGSKGSTTFKEQQAYIDGVVDGLEDLDKQQLKKLESL